MISTLSFDLDGTLTDDSFDTLLWDEVFPRLYSEVHGVSLDVAKRFVFREYGVEHDKNDPDWYDPVWWLERFGIEKSWSDILKDLKTHVKHYSDVHEVLPILKRKGFRLVIITNAHERLALVKLELEDLSNYFDAVFSVPSTFRSSRKDVGVYEKVLEVLGIRAGELLHVGNDTVGDVSVPKRLGIRSVFLDRSGKKKDALHGLKEVLNIVEG